MDTILYLRSHSLHLMMSFWIYCDFVVCSSIKKHEIEFMYTMRNYEGGNLLVIERQWRFFLPFKLQVLMSEGELYLIYHHVIKLVETSSSSAVEISYKK